MDSEGRGVMTTNAELAAAFEAAAEAAKPPQYPNVPAGYQGVGPGLYTPSIDADRTVSRVLAAIAAVYRGLAEKEAEPGGRYHVGNQFPTGHENGYMVGQIASSPLQNVAIGGYRSRMDLDASTFNPDSQARVTLESERDCGCRAGECRKPLADGTMGVKECAYINPEGFIRWSCGRVTREG